MAGGCFGIVYAFFLYSLVALGITFSPVIKSISRIIIWAINLTKRPKVKQTYELAPFDWSAIIFALFSVVIIIALGRRNSDVYWSLPLLSVGLYVLFSIYISSGQKLRKIEIIENHIIHTKEKENIAQLGDPEKLRKDQLLSLALILILPIAVGGVSGELLDATMRVAQVRADKDLIIHIKEPYSSLVPTNKTSHSIMAPRGYIAFDQLIVLFKGFGKFTVISFKKEGKARNLEIPNSHLIIQKRYRDRTPHH